jgi:hypothetical protein
MEEKGILTPEQEKKLAELLDNVIKLKGILELIDGYVFKALITFLDDKFADQIKVEIKLKLAELVDAVLAEDVELAEGLAAEVINMLLDVPGLDEESEGLLFKGIVQLLVGVVVDWINSKKEEPVTLQLNR